MVRLDETELAALRRFDECAQDGEGYDLPKEMMQRLAEIGVVRRQFGANYIATTFGLAVLSNQAAESALLRALRDGIELKEPVNTGKALRAHRVARVCLSGGTGPVACAMLVNIQLTGWADGPEKTEAYVKGFNDALKYQRHALLEVAGTADAVG